MPHGLVLVQMLTMFGLFKKKSEKDKLDDVYEKLMAESYKLSHTNRAASDTKRAEAEAVLKKIEALEAEGQ